MHAALINLNLNFACARRVDTKHPQYSSSGYTAAVRQRGQEPRKSEAGAEAPPQKKEEPSKSIQIELGDTILEGGALLEQKARQLGLLTLVRHEMV